MNKYWLLNVKCGCFYWFKNPFNIYLKIVKIKGKKSLLNKCISKRRYSQKEK